MTICFNAELFDDLQQKAEQSPRKRSHMLLHNAHIEPVQRICMALIPGTYIHPHRHPQENKWELLTVLSGTISLLEFDDVGTVTNRLTLSNEGPNHAIQLPANSWHTIFPTDNTAIVFEVKEGPFEPIGPESFAEWAPKEGDPACSTFLDWAATAQTGDSYPQHKLPINAPPL